MNKYAIAIDYVLEDKDTGETEFRTTVIWAEDDENPYEAADRWMGELEDRYEDRYYVWSNDVYAP